MAIQDLTPAAEGVLLGALVLAPWPYGCAPDWARYLLVALLGLGLLLFALARIASRAPAPALGWCVLALPAMAALQLGLGQSAAPVWTAQALLLLLTFLGVTVFWSERARSRAAALRLAAAVLLGCGAQAAFAALQWSRSPEHIYGRKLEIVTMPFGSYVNHNHFAGLIAMGTLVAAGLALGHVRQHRNITPLALGLGGLTLALGATLGASRSRGGLVALVAGLGCLGFGNWALLRARRRGGVAPWLPLAFALGLLGFALAVVPAETRRRLSSVLVASGDESASYRLDVARDTLRLALSRPLLGSGLGAFADAFPAFKRGHGDVRTTHAESDVLEFLAEGGLLGLLALGWLAASVGRAARERLAAGHDALRGGLLLGALAALGALLAHACVDFSLRLPANALLAASLLGLVAAPRQAAASRAPRWLWLPLAAAALAVTLGGAWWAWGAVALERAQAQPRPLLRLARLDEALRLHPWLDEAWRERGVLQRQLAIPGSALRASRIRYSLHDLRAALRLRPSWGQAWSELGHAQWLSGDPQGALVALERAQALDPTHAGIAFLRADLQASAGDTAGAAATLGRLLEQSPGWWSMASAELLRFSRDPRLLAPLAGTDPVRQEALRKALEPASQP